MLIFRISGAVFYLILCVLFTAGEEVVKRLQELEGNTVTLHTGLTGDQSDAQIVWLHGEDIIMNTQTNVKYNTDRFRDRLQLDRSSGSLNIRNISREDSGLYRLHIITGTVSVWRFSVKVYAPVSEPAITNRVERRRRISTESCSPVCSVENGENVSLSWYEDKERISSISRADSSDSSLHLPLNRTFPNCYTYTCVSDNPVSNQTTQLNIAQLCPFNTGGCKDEEEEGKSPAAVLISVGVFGAALILLLLIWFWKKKKKISASEDGEMNYADVRLAPQRPEDSSTKNSNKKKCRPTRVQDQDQSVVYSDIRT